MFQSSSPRSTADRQKTADALQPCVLSGIDLYNAVKVAHWNVRGPAFGPLHELFGAVASDVEGWVDRFAERIAQLGVIAQGLTQQVAMGSRLTESPFGVTDGFEHCRLLFDRFREMVMALTEARNACDDMGAIDTVQLLSDAALAFDKMAWKIVAHIPSPVA